MTEATVMRMDAGQADDDVPPRGTAIVRPLRHVRAVRERHLLRFAAPADVAASRSARAWAWALGETTNAPVTGQQTVTPPSRSQIEAEITTADDRRLRGDRENRADAAATILRWLIGADDHLPVRGDNPGELVGGFGDVVRSQAQIAAVLAAAAETQRLTQARDRDLKLGPDDRRSAREDADYLDGVAATLAWVGARADAPITRSRSRGTTKDLKLERVHANDVIEQATSPWMPGRLPSPLYGEGVKSTISWLLGDSTAPPVESACAAVRRPGCELET